MPNNTVRAGGKKLLVRSALIGALAFGGLATAPTPTAHADDSYFVQSGSKADKRHTKRDKRAERREKRLNGAASKRIAKAFNIARAQQGDPYAYGASGPNAFDCSGLMQYSFRKAGYRGIPRTSSAQAGWAKKISRKQMRKGDFIFFTGSGGVYHVGLYAGHGKILHAPYSGTRVRTDGIWGGNWFAGRAR